VEANRVVATRTTKISSIGFSKSSKLPARIRNLIVDSLKEKLSFIQVAINCSSFTRATQRIAHMGILIAPIP